MYKDITNLTLQADQQITVHLILCEPNLKGNNTSIKILLLLKFVVEYITYIGSMTHRN